MNVFEKGSGKSTVAKMVKEMVDEMGRRCEIIPMDGYHIRRSDLSEELLGKRGCPESFNKDKFISDIR